jgi:hypothetical protein
MSKVKVTLSVVAALFALSAIASASASAAAWKVGGAELKGSAALATTAKTDKAAKLKAAGVTIECIGSALKGVNPVITQTNTGSATSLEFTECSSLNENCTVPTTIGTVALTATASVGTAPDVKAVFAPKTKNTFATIKYEGEKCALLGTQPVTGKATVDDPTGQNEAELQIINAVTTEASGELKVGSSPAELLGSALLKLASSSKWAFN